MSSTSLPPLPPGYAAAYRGTGILDFAAIMMAILSCFALLRVIARIVSKTQFGIDDYLAIPALLGTYGICGLTIASVKDGGLGRHVLVLLETHPEKLVNLSKLEIAFAVSYIISTTFPKLSMLYLFLRIFVARWSRNACYTLMTILSMTLFANFMAVVLQCIPLSKAWNPTAKGHCVDQNALLQWSSLPNIITDVMMLALPLPVLIQLQTSWKDKIGIILTFAAGSTGLITSCLRFAAFITSDSDGPSADGTWVGVNLSFYSISEASVYFIACCLPTYRSLYLTIRRKAALSSTQGATNGYFSKSRWKAFSNQESAGTQLASYPAARGKVASAGFTELEGDENYLIENNSSQPVKDPRSDT